MFAGAFDQHADVLAGETLLDHEDFFHSIAVGVLLGLCQRADDRHALNPGAQAVRIPIDEAEHAVSGRLRGAGVAAAVKVGKARPPSPLSSTTAN